MFMANMRGYQLGIQVDAYNDGAGATEIDQHSSTQQTSTPATTSTV